MGLFDSLGSLFSSGSGAASAGPSWVSMLGPLISSIHARPNAGASKGDMARANRINLLTGLFGGLATAYGARQDANAQAEANKGLFDIIAKGGGERLTEAAGPVMPGMERPTAMTKIPMSAAFAELGASNPRLQDSALKLALAAQDSEHQDLWAQKRMDLEQSRYNTEQDWRQKTFDAEQAYRNTQLGLTRDNIKWEQAYKERQLNDPWTQAAKYESVAPGAGAEYLSRALGGPSTTIAPGTERDDGKIGGFTPAVQPQTTQHQASDPRLGILGVVAQAKADKEAQARGDLGYKDLIDSNELKELSKSYPMLGVMQEAMKTSSRAADLAAVTAVSKNWKPNEGVMSGDAADTLATAGLQRGVISKIMSFLGGEDAVLDSKTKADLFRFMVRATTERENAYKAREEAARAQYGKSFAGPWNRPSAESLLQQSLGGGQNSPLGAGGINMFDQNIPQFRSNGQRIVGWEP